MTVYIVDIEAVDTRYTGQWKTHVPELLKKEGHDVQVLSGPTDIPNATTPGAFLNFGGTNVYKSAQVEQMGRLFCSGAIKPGDHFLFTDAWHPGIINLKYMSELLNIPITTHGLWHAGSYDPQDFLGRLVGKKKWVRHAEKSFYHAFDHNYFATEFHVRLFMEELLEDGFKSENPWFEEDWAERYESGKIILTGWPMEYMENVLASFKGMKKQNLILFPHRIAPEKQVEIFRDLAKHLPQYEFVVCQDEHLTKEQYHTLLGRAKLVFSANLQETLGISCYEGAVVDAVPMVPDRLSYSEMYMDIFKYPSKWTESYQAYEVYRPDLCCAVMTHMDYYDIRISYIKKQTELLTENFFSATNLVRNIK
jgi:hypothetical protein